MAINILILTDYSEPSLNAAKYALNLFETTSNFYILNSGKNETALMNKFMSNLSGEMKTVNHNLSSVFSADNLVEATRKAVSEKNIDLIVMGASGVSSSQIKGLGSNTYRVIRKVKCPVLTITENQQFKPWENLIFPVDYTVIFYKGILEFFKKLPLPKALVFNMWEINTTQIEDKLDVYRSKIKSKLSPHSVKFKELEVVNQLGEHFWENAKNNADLVVLIARNLKVSEELLMYSPVSEKGKNNRPPVLIIHD